MISYSFLMLLTSCTNRYILEQLLRDLPLYEAAQLVGLRVGRAQQPRHGRRKGLADRGRQELRQVPLHRD